MIGGPRPVCNALVHDTGVLAVVLAAGSGSRFEGPDHKLLLRLGDRTLVEHAVAAAARSGVGRLLVIAGAVSLPATLTEHYGAEVLHNPRWASGQATSLALAIDEAERRGVDAIVVGLGDQPSIEPEAWAAVARSDAPIAVATYDGRPRNPVRLARAVWPLVPRNGDEGARSVIRLYQDLVERVPCQGSPADIDTLEDLARWQSRSSTNSP